MKYKIGDKVRIKSLDWYNENKNEFGEVWTSGGKIPFNKYMSYKCGKVMTISFVGADYYTMVEDLVGYWTDEMIEGLAEEETLIERVDGKLKLESIKRVREYWSEYARIFIEIYDDEPNECVLTHLYTLESHRKKGYGKQALSEAESIAKELGCHTAHLKVETGSWMHQWYLRCGYSWNKNADEGYTWLIKKL